ncbi:MAG: tRNA guanosine(34) transglycosylase Tgt [Myxococcota bacterium]|nr:tRNA guanosine(34) transglycosylase Tgt [Myxococcales bacterium]
MSTTDTASRDGGAREGARGGSHDAGAPLAFALEATSGDARTGVVTTPHGRFATPAFMPVGTHGAVKAMTPAQVRATGAEVVLANTYHLALRPGEGLVEKLGGLHGFMRWDGPILTDSGGFQVFSLPKVAIDDRGVRFQNEVTGERMELTPERSIEIQNALGADIIMAFDECTPYPAARELAATGVRRTLAWMERCMRAHARPGAQALFAIVQGSVYPDLRSACAQSLAALDCPGYAIGGVSVGEGHELLCQITSHTAPLLPAHKPRYLMGVGLPHDLLAAIGYGIDMFDCVIPTRYARSATVFTARGRIRLTNRRYRRDGFPIDPTCDCEACAGGFSRAYLHHLFAANEVLSAILCSLHNVRFYERLMARAREAIAQDAYAAFRSEFLAEYDRNDGRSGD